MISQLSPKPDQIARMVNKLRMYENGASKDRINDVGFTKVATIEEKAENVHVKESGYRG